MPRSLCYDISSRYRDPQAYPSTGVFGVSFVNPSVPPLVFPAAPYDLGQGELELCGSVWKLRLAAGGSFVSIPGVYEGSFLGVTQPCMSTVAWGVVVRALPTECGGGLLVVRPTALPPAGPALPPPIAALPCPSPGPDPTTLPRDGPVAWSLRRALPRAEGTVAAGGPDGPVVPVTPFPSWLGTYAPPPNPPPCPCPRDRRRPRCCSGLPAYKVMLVPQFAGNPLNTGVGRVYDLVAWSAADGTFVLDPPFLAADHPPPQPGCWGSWRWELWVQVGGAAVSRSSFTGPKRWQCGSGTGLGTVRLRDVYVPCSSRLAGGLGYICDLPYIYVQLWPEHGNQCNESFGSFAPVETTQRLTYKVAVNAPGPRVKLWQQLPAGYDSPTASSPQPWTFLHVWVLAPDGTPLSFEPLMPNAYPESGPDQYSQVMLTIDATWLD